MDATETACSLHCITCCTLQIADYGLFGSSCIARVSNHSPDRLSGGNNMQKSNRKRASTLTPNMIYCQPCETILFSEIDGVNCPSSRTGLEECSAI
eukprot:2548793-Amphidinium_carterae.1